MSGPLTRTMDPGHRVRHRPTGELGTIRLADPRSKRAEVAWGRDGFRRQWVAFDQLDRQHPHNPEVWIEPDGTEVREVAR